jgi:hypothetical protein
MHYGDSHWHSCTAVQLAGGQVMCMIVEMANRLRACCRDGPCPYCNEGRSGRAVHDGHFSGGLRTTMKGGRPLPLPTKSTLTTGDATSSSGASVPGPFTALPELWAFLTAESLPDGTRRLAGKISFSCASLVITASLTDPSTGLYVARSNRSMDDLLLCLEEGLATSSLDWRASKYPSRGRK